MKNENGEIMKAVRIHGFGGRERLVYEDAPRPKADAGEVLIRVHAAGVNPVDWKTRKGDGVAGQFNEFPAILGWDVSGTVTGLGERAGGIAIGDEVYGMIRFPKPGAAYAEYAAAPVGHLVRKPKSLDHISAAAVPLAALTAWQALFSVAQLKAGQRVLIHAAAGGVGHLAVQLAKWKGLYVAGAASAGNAAMVKELGADEIFDYRSGPFEYALKDFDAAIDTVGGDIAVRSYAVLKPGGVMVSILGGGDPERAREMDIRSVGMLVKPDAGQLREITAQIDAGRIKPWVESVLPLAGAAEAHALSESGRTRGKIVLKAF